MPKGSRRGSRGLQRRPPRREPKQRILIICEGRVTEAGYFKDLRRAFRNPLVEVEIDDQKGVPKTLVERAAVRKKAAERDAKSQRDEFLSYDEVWCVFDVDEHPHLSDARQQARDNGIDLAISNPCFELWALLHFQDHSAFVERKRLRGMLKRHLPKYDKALPFKLLRPGYLQAVQRATDLDRRREEAKDVGGNPSTGVYRLPEKIRLGGA
jgi:RloB-like protein